MAGDWLKMDCGTPDKPEVLSITARMGWDDPDLTVGKLFRVWRWFDQHTTNGNAAGVTEALLDRIAGVAGFASAMASVHWLVITEAGLSLPNFGKHNGATAKSRAQTAKRVANHRSEDESNAESNAPTVTAALAREDKREEKKEKKETARRRATSFDAEAIELPDWLSREVWSEWVKERRSRGKPITERGAREQLKALDGYRRNGHSPERVIAHAIASGNQGLYPPPVLKGSAQQSNGLTTAGESVEQYQARMASERAADRARATPPPASVLAIVGRKPVEAA